MNEKRRRKEMKKEKFEKRKYPFHLLHFIFKRMLICLHPLFLLLMVEIDYGKTISLHKIDSKTFPYSYKFSYKVHKYSVDIFGLRWKYHVIHICIQAYISRTAINRFWEWAHELANNVRHVLLCLFKQFPISNTWRQQK